MLTILFVITAALYASIGLGGGSTYIALMVLFGVTASQIPITALICNICVVSINLIRYRGTPFPYRILLPLLCSSIPMAYLGGQTEIPQAIFQILLGTILIFSGIAMGIQREDLSMPYRMTLTHCIVIGGILGGLAGIIGIGGGIFLIPILYAYNIGSPAQIARIASGFIFFNSISGLIGQVTKVENFLFPFSIIPMTVAVMLGALIGTQLHLKILKRKHVRWVTIFLIEFVAVRILWLVWTNY